MAEIIVRTTLFGAVPTIEMIEELKREKILECEIQNDKLVQMGDSYKFIKQEYFDIYKHILNDFLYKYKMIALLNWSDDSYNWLGYIIIYPNYNEVEIIMPIGDKFLCKSPDEFIEFMNVDIEKMITEYEDHKKEMEIFYEKMKEKASQVEENDFGLPF